MARPELLDKMTKAHKKLQDNFIDTFKGVPVRKDNKLSGNDYYIAVSPTVYRQINEATRPQGGE